MNEHNLCPEIHSKETLKMFEQMMEEMANAPKEEMGKRQPGEKGSYERNFMSEWYQ